MNDSNEPGRARLLTDDEEIEDRDAILEKNNSPSIE